MGPFRLSRPRSRPAWLSTSPMTRRGHAAEDCLQIAHPDADDPPAAAEGRELACRDAAAEGGDADAEHLGGLRERDKGAGLCAVDGGHGYSFGCCCSAAA